MKFPFSHRGTIRTVTFLSAAFVLICGFAISEHQQALQYKRYLQASYCHAFSELTTAVSEIDTALKKGMYAHSPAMISSLCTEVFGKAMTAQLSMGELPYANVELEQTAAFVAKVGDYVYALARSTADSGGYSEEDLTNLDSLSNQAASLAGQLETIQTSIQDGSYTLEDVAAAEKRLAADREENPSQADGGYQEIEGQFSAVPALIYDGPFSDHIQNRFPAMLDGRAEISEQEGLEIAASFTGLRSDIFSPANTVEGRIPSFSYSAAVDGGELTIGISRAGGMVLTMFNSRTPGDATLSPEEEVAAAKAFLESKGFSSMKESYYINQSNILTVNFAFMQDDVLCYPDLIKVGVAMDNGRIIGFESKGYSMNHTTRTLAAPSISLAEAQLKVSPRLKQLSHQMAVIPTMGQNELLCYEFKCETESGQHFIVYINSQTGKEERMFLLLESENGTLVL